MNFRLPSLREVFALFIEPSDNRPANYSSSHGPVAIPARSPVVQSSRAPSLPQGRPHENPAAYVPSVFVPLRDGITVFEYGEDGYVQFDVQADGQAGDRDVRSLNAHLVRRLAQQPLEFRSS